MTERPYSNSGHDNVSSRTSSLKRQRMLVSTSPPLFDESVADGYSNPTHLSCMQDKLAHLNGFKSRSDKKLQLEKAYHCINQLDFSQCVEVDEMQNLSGAVWSSTRKHGVRESTPDRLTRDTKKCRRSSNSPVLNSPKLDLTTKYATRIPPASTGELRGDMSLDPPILHRTVAYSGCYNCVTPPTPMVSKMNATTLRHTPVTVSTAQAEELCPMYSSLHPPNCKRSSLPPRNCRPSVFDRDAAIEKSMIPFPSLCVNSPLTAPSPNSSYTGSVPCKDETRADVTRDRAKQVSSLRTLDPDLTGTQHHLPKLLTPIHRLNANNSIIHRNTDLETAMVKSFDNSLVYTPGIDLLVDGVDMAPLDLISRFSNTPVSSPDKIGHGSDGSVTPLNPPSFSQPPDQVLSYPAQRPASSPRTSSLSNQLIGADVNKTTKTTFSQLRQQRKRMEFTEREPLPALHLHLSKDGTSPLPPGWQRALNTKQTSSSGEKRSDPMEHESSDMYAYYYYHVRTRQTRWDPPVYPWDADPMDTLSGDTGEDDPEAPYNWGCASKFAVTHDEIEAMYTRLRQRILERQCTDLLHELAGRPDAPQGTVEQGFALELFILVHNVLRTFRDARCKLGRILNEEDLYYLTKKLSQSIILKEVQKLRNAQAASSASLFAPSLPPEVNSVVQARVTGYVKRYMTSKGSYYVRRVQAPIPPVHVAQQQVHLSQTHSRIDNYQLTSSTQPMGPGEATHECSVAPNIST